MFEFRIGEVGDALEQREVSHDREREAREHDRLAADLVGQPTEEDEAWRADRERDRDHDLRGDAGNFQCLREEEQRVELAAVPHHGLAGGGAEKREDRDFEVVPLTESFHERSLRLLALFDHLFEERRFIELEPDPERDGKQDCRQQERKSPAPGAEFIFAHSGADAEDQEERKEQAERCRGLNPGGVIAALVLRCVLGDVDRRAAIFAAKCEALDEPQRNQHDRRHDAPSGKARQHADEERPDAHQRHRDKERVFAADQVAKMAEDQRAKRAAPRSRRRT